MRLAPSAFAVAKRRALISSVVTRLPPPPPASSVPPPSSLSSPAPRHSHSTGGTCPRHLLLYILNIARPDASTKHVKTRHNKYVRLPTTTTPSCSPRHRRRAQARDVQKHGPQPYRKHPKGQYSHPSIISMLNCICSGSPSCNRLEVQKSRQQSLQNSR